MEEAFVFFRDLLGFEVAHEGLYDPDVIGPFAGVVDPDISYAIVKCPDGSEIELLEWRRPKGRTEDPRKVEDVGIAVVTLLVDNVDASIELLTQNGYPAKGPVIAWGPNGEFRAVHLHGPGGIPVTIGTLDETLVADAG